MMTAHRELLLERDREIAALDAAVVELGQLVVIEGPPGVGKSRLVAEAAARAADRGLIVLSGTGIDLERQVAFGVAAQLFGPLLARANRQDRERYFDGAATLAKAVFYPAAAHSGDSGGAGEASIQGLYWLTENLAAVPGAAEGTRPLLFAVDDAQWADEASLRFLIRLAARLPGLPVVMVVALRAGAGSQHIPLLEQLRAHPSARVLRPAPLSDEGVSQLVGTRLPDADDEFSRACGQVTGGNPFFLGALLDELIAEGVEPVAESAAMVARLVPSAAGRAVLARLGRLPDHAISLARAVAVMGDRTPLAFAAVLAGLGDDDAEDAADVLAAADLLRPGDPLSFTHSLIAAAVESDLPAFARARAHRQAAELLEAAGAPAGSVAAHLLVCRPRRDPWVVGVLCGAAEAATSAGQHRSAAELLTRALQEPPDETTRPRVGAARAMAAAASGEPGAERELRKSLDLIGDPAYRAEAELRLARLLIARGDFGAAAEAADRGLSHVPNGDPVEGRLLNVSLMATSRHAPRRGEALSRFAPMARAAREGRLPDDPVLAGRLASRMSTAGEDPATVRALAARALAAGPLVDDGTLGIPFAFVAAGIFWVGDYEWCQRAAENALDAARAQGSPLAMMAASHWQAAASHQLGQLNLAVVHAERAIAIHMDGWDALVAWTSAILVAIHLARGEHAGAREALSVAVRTDPQSLDWAFVLEARGRMALFEGRAGDALADFGAAGSHLAGTYRIDNPEVLPWRSLSALACAQLGRRKDGIELASAELAMARRLGLALSLGHALRVHGLLQGGLEGISLLEEAVGVLHGSPARLAYAEALVDFGTRVGRSGKPTAARKPLAEALSLAETFAAAPLKQRAEHELHAAGGRRRHSTTTLSSLPAAGLTPAQQRVAQLAADGMSNPQIAQRLYLTAKTVEWHLAKVYRELRVANRQQLADLMRGARRGPP